MNKWVGKIAIGIAVVIACLLGYRSIVKYLDTSPIKTETNYFTNGPKMSSFETYLTRKPSTDFQLQPVNFNTTVQFKDCRVTMQTFKGNVNNAGYYVLRYNKYCVVLHGGAYKKTSGTASQSTLQYLTSVAFKPESKVTVLGQGFLGSSYSTLFASDFSMCGYNLVSYAMVNDPRSQWIVTATVIDTTSKRCATGDEINDMIQVAYHFASTTKFW